jgi:long-chain acyl-CoA synthetase
MGAVINPINVMLSPAEVAFVTRDCGAKALIGSRDKLAPALDAAVEGLTTIVFGTESLSGAALFDELVTKPAGFEVVAVDPEHLSTIGYTSGTTGHPKGAMQSQRAVILNGAMTAQMHAKTAADTVVTALPCPHVYGNVVFNGAMMYGLTLVLHSRFDAAEVLGSIQAHRVTMLEAVPTMYMYILAHPGFDAFDLSALTRCTVGGQTMPATRCRRSSDGLGAHSSSCGA